MGIAALGADARRATVLAGPAADHLAALDDADVVICDPPRRGIEPPLLARLAAAPPPRLVLVSCHLQTFLAEARTLLGGDRLVLRGLGPFALFPYTAHVETVALFERRAVRG